MESSRPRFAPEFDLPPYTYVPGQTPHPVTDPRGHMFGATPEALERPGLWSDCRTFRHGIDLFNHGYYWEAHEVWERLWITVGREGVAADFLKSLIKLAAAGVKIREGNQHGAERHLARAAQLLEQTIESTAGPLATDFGLNLEQLLGWAREPAPDVEPARYKTAPVFDFVLTVAD